MGCHPQLGGQVILQLAGTALAPLALTPSPSPGTTTDDSLGQGGTSWARGVGSTTGEMRPTFGFKLVAGLARLSFAELSGARGAGRNRSMLRWSQ